MADRGKKPEAVQQDAILQWFAVQGVLAYRINTGAVKIGDRFVRFGVTGFSDVVAFPWFPGETRPRVLFCEVKSATRRQRPEQKSFAAQVEEHGMHYLLARGVDDVEAWCRQHAKEAA